MGMIADDVVGGFNEFVDRQRDGDDDVRVSLVQFDSQDPFEVVFDGVGIGLVPPLTRATYVPRASTPLYDAVGQMIAKADEEISTRAEKGLVGEDQIVLIVTDGRENASVEHTRASVLSMVENRRARGWVFTFLGADQDSFREGAKVGVAPGNRFNWAKTPYGVKKMWSAAAYSTRTFQDKDEALRKADADVFFKQDPEEQD